MPLCNQCRKVCQDYHELAIHIMSLKSHRRGRRWAGKYLAINSLSPEKRRDLPKRVADNPDKETTEFGDENKANRIRQVSGVEKSVITVCPKCEARNRIQLPIEFAESPAAWRINGILVKLCARCS